MSSDRTANFWQQAEYATSRADKARSDELRRAWLIVARDWANMARREQEKVLLQKLAYVAETAPMAPVAGHDDLLGITDGQSEEAKQPAQ
jgi:hypothetical protein